MQELKQGLDKAAEMIRTNAVEDIDPMEDPDDLVLLLKYCTSDMFDWSLMPDRDGTQVTTFIHSASVLDNGVIHFNVQPDYIQEKGLHWARFIEEVMYIVEHEAVHMNQRDKMGHDFWASDERKSGYQKARDHGDKIKGGEDRPLTADEDKEGMRLYLADPQEIMAHAINLAHEIKQSDDPKMVLTDPEGFIDHLPTWAKYRRVGFLRADPVMKRLLKYTYQYINQ